ncbi:amidohydrolase family protein [Haloarculaceae archaeon H-GB2-1]|nr:amidohydrolase family protein [Haloarculaceae archaeon H-GB1-1]MEA5387984.1 amidohydrolase family protein [Haloarculaceae archaeon H-GB11]MEA5409475.1 amidohydrolase family protein [Haloarculaceae archaeon H-GB2-1]
MLGDNTSDQIAESNGTVLVTNGVLVDGTAGDPVPNAGVVIENERITDVGPVEGLDVPDDIEEIDVGGQTIMPGLVEAHTHMSQYKELNPVKGKFRAFTFDNTIEYNALKAAENLEKMLATGATTIRDMAGRDLLPMSLRDAVEDGTIVGPRVNPTGPMITSTGGSDDNREAFRADENLSNGREANGKAGIVREVREMFKAGATHVKLEGTGSWLSAFSGPHTQTLSQAEMEAAVEEAHRKDMTVAIHAQGNEAIKAAARAGVDTIEHGNFADEEALRLIEENGSKLNPTLTPFNEFAKNAETCDLTEQHLADLEADRKASEKSFQLALEMDTPMFLGADSYPPLGLHEGGTAREARYWVEYGADPKFTIEHATRESAKALERDDEIGTLETGKYGDLLVVDGRPHEDIDDLRPEQMSIVMKGGTVVKRRDTAA